jgi:hypothetical protein
MCDTCSKKPKAKAPKEINGDIKKSIGSGIISAYRGFYDLALQFQKIIPILFDTGKNFYLWTSAGYYKRIDETGIRRSYNDIKTTLTIL